MCRFVAPGARSVGVDRDVVEKVEEQRIVRTGVRPTGRILASVDHRHLVTCRSAVAVHAAKRRRERYSRVRKIRTTVRMLSVGALPALPAETSRPAARG